MSGICNRLVFKNFLKPNSLIKKIILFLYIALITTMSILPASDIPKLKTFPYFDKMVHIIMYAGLSYLMLWNLSENSSKRKYLGTFCFVFGWGFLMEIIQGISNMGRSFELIDIIANTSGIILGFITWVFLTKYVKRKYINFH